MNAERFEELLAAEAGGELSAAETVELNAACQADENLGQCRAADQRLVGLLRARSVQQAPRALAASVMRRIAEEMDDRSWKAPASAESERQSARKAVPWWAAFFGSPTVRLGFGVAVVAIVVTQIMVLDHQGDPTPKTDPATPSDSNVASVPAGVPSTTTEMITGRVTPAARQSLSKKENQDVASAPKNTAEPSPRVAIASALPPSPEPRSAAVSPPKNVEPNDPSKPMLEIFLTSATAYQAPTGRIPRTNRSDYGKTARAMADNGSSGLRRDRNIDLKRIEIALAMHGAEIVRRDASNPEKARIAVEIPRSGLTAFLKDLERNLGVERKTRRGPGAIRTPPPGAKPFYFNQSPRSAQDSAAGDQAKITLELVIHGGR